MALASVYELRYKLIEAYAPRDPARRDYVTTFPRACAPSLRGGQPFLGLQTGAVLHRQYDFRPRPPETLLIQRLDESGERDLPGVLVVVVDRSQFLRVHSQLARHLHLRMRQLMTFAGVDPVLEFLRDSLACHVLSLPVRAAQRGGLQERMRPASLA
jgi:hypothetical protein